MKLREVFGGKFKLEYTLFPDFLFARKRNSFGFYLEKLRLGKTKSTSNNVLQVKKENKQIQKFSETLNEITNDGHEMMK